MPCQRKHITRWERHMRAAGRTRLGMTWLMQAEPCKESRKRRSCSKPTHLMRTVVVRAPRLAPAPLTALP